MIGVFEETSVDLPVLKGQPAARPGLAEALGVGGPDVGPEGDRPELRRDELRRRTHPQGQGPQGQIGLAPAEVVGPGVD